MLHGGFLPHTPSAERSPRAAKEGGRLLSHFPPASPRHSPPPVPLKGEEEEETLKKNLQEKERNVVLFFVRCKREQIEQTHRRYVMSVAIV